MEPTLKIALVAAASAIAGGLITGVIAPHIAWGIEKKKQKLAARIELIAKWRKMVQDVQFDFNNRKTDDRYTFEGLLNEYDDFFALLPHLNQETKAVIKSVNSGFKAAHFGQLLDLKPGERQIIITPAIELLVREIANIEREWQLI